jgi:hypothetical protein
MFHDFESGSVSATEDGTGKRISLSLTGAVDTWASTLPELSKTHGMKFASLTRHKCSTSRDPSVNTKMRKRKMGVLDS